MSGPRSRSPRSRRLLWDKPDFDSHRVSSELDVTPLDRSHRSRDVPEEHFFRDPMREEQVREGQRRSPYFPEDRHFRNQNLSKEEELYRHRRRDVLGHVDDTGGDGGRHRGGFREQLQSFETRGRSPYSPLRKGRERSLLTSHSHSDHQQRRMEMGWRREEQERGGGRFRDISPGARLDDKRWGTGRERQGRRDAQGLNRDRRREEPHQRETLSERNPPAKRQRRDVDGVNHLGYRNEENFGDRCYSLDTARDGFVGDRQGSLPRVDTLNTEPLIIEHDHGITDSRVLPRWDQFEKRGGLEPDLERRRIPRLMGSSQELLRTSNNRLELHEDTRRFHIQDNLRNANNLNTRRSPVQQVRQNPVRPGNRDGPTSQKGRTGPQPARERLNYGQDGRTGLPKNQPRFQQGHQDPPHEEQIPGYRSLREESYVEPDEQGHHWAEEQRHDGSGSVGRLPPRMNLDPKMPRQRQHGWNDLKMNNMTVVTEETLTVKVDMSRPVNQNSSLCYSSDRQLSLDLVNVGRQRLDFLPMLEHSGTYRESTTHTGTFAQEIITLVHQVKEQYFRGDGITLNERFSAPQKGSFSEEETVELTLNQRFSASQGFSLNSSSVPDDNVPLFSRLGPIQDLNQLLVRDPGDLRHNLERRRQERLEGVKVTIQGTSTLVRGMDPVRELEDSDGGDLAQMEGGEFSILLQEQNRRQELNMAQRRAAPLQINSGPQLKDNRGRKQRGPMRRKNTRNNLTGPNW